MNFQLKQTDSPTETVIEIDGYIDEHAVFPKIKANTKLRIKLGGVKGLNSAGTRSWIRWINDGLPQIPISLELCPFILVKTFGHVVGSAPKNAKIESFYVPYISDETDEKKNVLYMRDINYFEDGTLKHPGILDSKGNAMTIDVLASYFRFLTQK